MNAEKHHFRERAKRWLEPELFRPFVFGVLLSLSFAEFARGAMAFSLLPTYGRTVLNFPVEWTALALSVHYLVDNILRPVSGWLADKLGQRILILTGFAISVFAIFWMMHTRTIHGLLGSAALYGLGMTPIWPSAFSGIGIGTPVKKRASFMGYLYIFWLLGTGAGPVIINFVIGRTYRMAFLILIGVNILGFIMAWLLVRKPAPVDGLILPEEPEDLKERMAVVRNRAYWLDMWRNVREMSFLFPGMFVQTFAVSSLIPILSLFAKVKLNLSGAMYSTILVTGGVLTVALLIPAGRLIDRFGPRRFLVPGFLVAGLALGLYPFRHTLVNTFLFVMVLGVSYAFILPAWNWVLDHSIDPDKKGALWGVFMTVEGAGSVVGPYVGGLMWDQVSPLAPFWLSGAVILVMGLLYLVLPIEGRKSKRPGPAGQPTRTPYRQTEQEERRAPRRNRQPHAEREQRDERGLQPQNGLNMHGLDGLNGLNGLHGLDGFNGQMEAGVELGLGEAPATNGQRHTEQTHLAEREYNTEPTPHPEQPWHAESTPRTEHLHQAELRQHTEQRLPAELKSLHKLKRRGESP